jgi:hypothetical protein
MTVIWHLQTARSKVKTQEYFINVPFVNLQDESFGASSRKCGENYELLLNFGRKIWREENTKDVLACIYYSNCIQLAQDVG